MFTEKKKENAETDGHDAVLFLVIVAAVSAKDRAGATASDVYQALGHPEYHASEPVFPCKDVG